MILRLFILQKYQFKIRLKRLINSIVGFDFLKYENKTIFI